MHTDEEATTTINYKLDKNTLKITQNPYHYGFWQLSLERGALPAEYRGQYTKRTEAIQAAETYIKNRPTASKD